MNQRRTRVYEGKAKILYEGPEPGTLIVHFKDDATAFNAQKKEVIDGKGVINNRICELIFNRLNEIGLPSAATGPNSLAASAASTNWSK